MPLRFLAVVVLAASVPIAGGAGCSKNPAGPDRVPAGQPFDLRVGSSSLVEGLTVRFDAVASDSRCPLDVQCVRAGEAVVSLTLSQSGSRVERQLKSIASDSETSFVGFTVKLVRVDPYPRDSRETPQEAYVATFTVTRD